MIYKSTIRFFEEISKIPRASGNEGGISEYLANFAKARGLEYSVDHTGNVLIKKDGIGENPVILQGHTDMVAEKNSVSDHDFEHDPIELIYEGDILHANGTTLGADNGIGIAASLAILDSDNIKHPPLECVFTVSEEIGLIGAGEFDFASLKGRRYLNLDCEGEGVATVACAGGVRCDTVYPVPADIPEIAGCDLKISIDGLAGGHSGEDINKRRTNAIVLLGDIISKAVQKVTEGGFSASLVSFGGGSKDNAIPRAATAVVRTDDSETFLNTLNEAAEERMLYLCDADMLARMSVNAVPCEGKCIGNFLLGLIAAMPNGVLEMEPAIEGCVRTSSNVAIVHGGDKGIEVTLSCRSSDDSELDGVIAKVGEVTSSFGGTMETRGRYPGWARKEESAVRPVYADAVRKVLGKEAQFMSIHAGLECGVVARKVPDMDMISFGPIIKDMHSPEECVVLASVERFCDILCCMLENM